MQKITRFAAVVCALAAGLRAGAATLTWLQEPLSYVWGGNDANWDGGAWAGGSDAVFGDSSTKSVTLVGNVSAGSVSVNAAGYSFGGTGSLTASGDLAVAADADLSLSSVTVTAARVTGSGSVTFNGTTLVSSYLRDLANAYVGADGLTLLTEKNDVTVICGLKPAPGCEKDGGIVKRGSYVLMQEAASCPSTISGDVNIIGGQIQFSDPAFFGYGRILCNPGYIFARNNATVTNRVLFSNEAYCGATSGTITFRNLGTVSGNTGKVVSFGRVNGGVSSVCLSLTDPANTALGCIRLRGGMHFSLNGGTVKMDSAATSPFFNTTDMTIDPVLTIGSGGIAFDVAGYTRLGMPLCFADTSVETITNVLETVTPSNNSFENAKSGWTFSGDCNVSENGTAFCNNEAYYTSDGTHYAYLRKNTSVTSQTLNVPTAGKWRVAFKGGCRPGEYSGHVLPITVSVNGGKTFSTLFPAQSSPYTFKRFETDVFDLDAGDYTIGFAAGNYGAGTESSYKTWLFDAVTLERVEMTDIPHGTFVKTGAGGLTVNGDIVTGGQVIVSNGTLKVSGCAVEGGHYTVEAGKLTLDNTAVSNLTVDVKGGRLEVNSGELTNVEVNVAAAAELVLSDLEGNVVVNGDFETPVLTARSIYNNCTAANWEWNRDEGFADSGIQFNGCDVSKNGYQTPSGNQTMYLRSGTLARQTVTVAEDGTYRLSFLQSYRQYSDCYNMNLSVTIDGKEVISVPPASAYCDYTKRQADVPLTAGSHVLQFKETKVKSANGPMYFIDDVRIEHMGNGIALEGNEFHLVSGSILNLQNDGKIVIAGGVYVDGVKFTGSEARLSKLGVVVKGAGHLQVGPPSGTVILLR